MMTSHARMVSGRGCQTTQGARTMALHAQLCSRRPAPAAHRREVRRQVQARSHAEEENAGVKVERRSMLAGLAGAGVLANAGGDAEAKTDLVSKEWEVVNLPLEPEVVLLDIAFEPNNPDHGF